MAEPAVVLRESHTDIIGFHNQSYRAIDHDSDRNSDKRQHERLHKDAPIGNRRQCDRHDLCREDEVGLDGACNFLILERLRFQPYRAQLSFMRVCLMWHDDFEDFFRPLVAEVGTAEHEKRRDHPRDEIAKGQSCGKQQQKFVAK